MTIFTSPIRSETYKLNSFDAIVSHINALFVVFYRNNHHDPPSFMPAEAMQDSFYRTLSRFPILAGDMIQRGDGGLEIVVDQDNLNMPEYHDSTLEDMHFDDFQSTSFDPRFWPKGLVNVGPVALKDRQSGRIKLLHVNIMRFKDNSGLALFINFAHAIGDAVMYKAFGDVWTEEMRAMETGEPAAQIPLLFDRAVVQDSLPSERTPLDDTTKALLTQPNSEAEKFARLQPHERHSLILERMRQNSGRQNSLFRIRTEQFGGLVQKVNRCASSGLRLSTNDIVVTLIAKTLAQAYGAVAATSGPGHNRQGLLKIDFPCDVRQRLGVPSNYMGNMLLQILTTSPIEQAQSPMTPQSVAEIATKVRTALDAARAPLIAEVYDTLEADPTRFTRPMMATNMFQQIVSITNQWGAPPFIHDFGYGLPEFVTTAPPFQDAAICILRARPQTDDMFVTLTEKPSVLEHVRANKAWSKVAESVF
ncbi:hypothetical protein EC988_004907 [Linderina pennispora]|nr:hypothetical protein EC988_004907 [Linderina pennispora]